MVIYRSLQSAARSKSPLHPGAQQGQHPYLLFYDFCISLSCGCMYCPHPHHRCTANVTGWGALCLVCIHSKGAMCNVAGA